jgi:VWFA-related protein
MQNPGWPSLSLLLAFLASPGVLSSQDKPGLETSPTLIRSNVREVLLDIVVRRKDVSLAKKLKASDFEITEDGVPQIIKTFRYVGGREARAVPQAPESRGPATRVASAQPNSLRQPNFVSIVFDEMGPDSRKNAMEAANDFLNQEFQANTYAAVFSLNLRLNAVQGFTNDRAVLALAVRRAVEGNSVELARATANVLNQTTYSIEGGRTGVNVAPTNDPSKSPDFATGSSGQAPYSEGQQAIAQAVSSQRDMTAYGTGMRTLNSLLRLIQYESRLPGRKTVLYLSEGLIKPPDRADMMRLVVGTANRGNVSFYCIDVRGLTTGSSNGAVSGLVQSAASLSATQSTVPSSPSAAMGQMQQDDQVQTALASHTQLNMVELAEGTGGFAVFSTNNFKGAMARVMEDVRTHYEISYVPTSTVYDGHFRKIEITVKDPKLVVQSREGYFAVPEIQGAPVMPFETAGLRVLDEAKQHDFDFRAAAMRFRPLGDGYRYEMGFDLSTAKLTTPVNSRTQKARIHATFLALVKDAKGQIVAKVSQEIDREVPQDKLEQFRRGIIIFTSPFEASSGRYTVEAAVTDPEGGRGSLRRFSLVVPKPGQPAVSDIELVYRLDPLDGPRDPGNPLEFAGGKIMPALAQTANAGKDAALFFVVYPESTAEKPKVRIEFFRDGKAVYESALEVGTADEVNSFPVLASAKLPAGEYMALVTVEQNGRTTQQSAPISVRP